jgi:hypothetical protein
MSKPVRVAFGVEGDTDLVMLKAAVQSLLGERDFVPTLLQPQNSEILQPTSEVLPLGWPGVYHWCQQTSGAIMGNFRNDVLFLNHDVLIIQLDADVAAFTYKSGHIEDNCQDLPFKAQCPPPHATTNRLRNVLLRWMHENEIPPRTVFCTPSKSLEGWIVVALYPNERVVTNKTIECREDPESILRGKPKAERLVHGKKKDVGRYKERANDFVLAWGQVQTCCSEAKRFSEDFLAAMPR